MCGSELYQKRAGIDTYPDDLLQMLDQLYNMLFMVDGVNVCYKLLDCAPEMRKLDYNLIRSIIGKDAFNGIFPPHASDSPEDAIEPSSIAAIYAFSQPESTGASASLGKRKAEDETDDETDRCTNMAFDDDLLADLDELDNELDDAGDDHSAANDASLRKEDDMMTDDDQNGEDEGDNSSVFSREKRTGNSTEIAALGEASTNGVLGEEHEALIRRLASKSDNIKSIAKLRYSQELQSLLESIASSQDKIEVDKQAIIGRIEDNPDYQLVLRANEISTRISGEIMVVHRFLIDHYKPRFPELETLVKNPVEYARSIKAIGAAEDITKVEFGGILTNATRMVVTVTGSTTVGSPLQADELQCVDEACECLLALVDAKQRIVGFIESRMPLIAPNLTAVIGSSTAAKLIVEAGGLTALSKIPACNIQVVGKTQQIAAGLSSITAKKHVGVIYYSDAVRNVPEDFRNKMLRKLSAKCALAARIDAQHESPDGLMGKRFRTELDAQVEKLLEAAPANAIKPLPVPDDGPKRRRAGRKVRKAREPYMSSELQKQRDRLQFGKFQEETVVMDEMEGSGMMGHSVGRVRATQMNNRAKAKVAKKYEKYMRAPTAGVATSGLASIAFTPTQGFEIANPQQANDEHRHKKAKTTHDKYFGSSTPFLKK
ncbi:U4/U6-U5 snRNP complex subunit prp31 [Coemansia sp. RSA 485]|nr:U4/U6-U5 snRNP complex subunit prp31 [Coemansia sp. RSA 485]